LVSTEKFKYFAGSVAFGDRMAQLRVIWAGEVMQIAFDRVSPGWRKASFWVKKAPPWSSLRPKYYLTFTEPQARQLRKMVEAAPDIMTKVDLPMTIRLAEMAKALAGSVGGMTIEERRRKLKEARAASPVRAYILAKAR